MSKYTNDQLDEAWKNGFDAFFSKAVNPYNEETEYELFEEWLDGQMFASQEEDEEPLQEE